MTSISLRGLCGDAGYADYGLKSIDDMVALIRDRARQMKHDAEAILAAADSDFHVATYRGILVQREYMVLQEGRPKP